MSKIIPIYFRMPYALRTEEGMIVAWNHQLDIHSSGHSETQAVEHLRADLALYFKTCNKLGTLRQVMEQAGFTWEDDGEDRIIIDGVRQPTVEVPVPFLLAAAYEQSRGH